MNDKRFWQGAMVGAAAALLLSNDKVRGKLANLVSGTGNLVKSGGSTVKEKASHTVVSVKENVTTGGEIFRDTYAAGKQGFRDSVERHNQMQDVTGAEVDIVEVETVELQAEDKPVQG